MDFPLPIRSISSTIDVSMPLFVDTNIVYKLDDTKFPGLNEKLNYVEPSLIMCPNVALESCTEPSTRDLDCEHDDLYNFIDSLDIDEPISFPDVPLDHIMDLLDIESDLPKDFSDCERNSCMFSTENLNQWGSVFEEYPNSLSLDADRCHQDSYTYHLNQFGRDDTSQEKASCGFPKRKRCTSTSAPEDVTSVIETEDLVGSKRRKLDNYHPPLNDISAFFGNANDDYLPYIFHEIGRTTASHSWDSPMKSFCPERQW